MRNRVGKWFSRLKLYSALMLTFNGIFLLAVMIIVLTTVVVTGNITTNNYAQYAGQMLDGLATNIEYIANDIKTMSWYVISDSDIQEILLMEESEEGYNEALKLAKAEIRRLIIERSYVESLSIYNFDGEGFSVGSNPSSVGGFDEFQKQEWYAEMLEKRECMCGEWLSFRHTWIPSTGPYLPGSLTGQTVWMGLVFWYLPWTISTWRK